MSEPTPALFPLDLQLLSAVLEQTRLRKAGARQSHHQAAAAREVELRVDADFLSAVLASRPSLDSDTETTDGRLLEIARLGEPMRFCLTEAGFEMSVHSLPVANGPLYALCATSPEDTVDDWKVSLHLSAESALEEYETIFFEGSSDEEPLVRADEWTRRIVEAYAATSGILVLSEWGDLARGAMCDRYANGEIGLPEVEHVVQLAMAFEDGLESVSGTHPRARFGAVKH